MFGYFQYYTDCGNLCTTRIEGSTRDMLRECKRMMKKDNIRIIRLITYKWLPAYNAATQVGCYNWTEILEVK